VEVKLQYFYTSASDSWLVSFTLRPLYQQRKYPRLTVGRWLDRTQRHKNKIVSFRYTT